MDTEEQTCPRCRAVQPWYKFECNYCGSDLPRRHSDGDSTDNGDSDSDNNSNSN